MNDPAYANIYKYHLEPGINELLTYEHVRFLHVDTQNSRPTIWAEVNPSEARVLRRILAVPTGGRVPSNAAYLGTAVDVGEDNFVWHVYLEHLSQQV